MKTKKRGGLKVALCGIALAALVSAGLQCAGTTPPPPADPVVVVPARPHPLAVWVNGHYAWKRWQQRYVWIPGHWQMRRGHRWVVVY